MQTLALESAEGRLAEMDGMKGWEVVSFEQVFPQMLAGVLRDLSEVSSVKDSRDLLNIDGASIFQFADERASSGTESDEKGRTQTDCREKHEYVGENA